MTRGSRLRSWFLAASLQRAAVEMGLLGALLMLPLATVFAGASEGTRASILVMGAMETGLVCGLIGAFRVWPITGMWRLALPRELAGALTLAAAVGVGVTVAGFVSLSVPVDVSAEAGNPWGRGGVTVVVGVAAAATTVVAYLPARGLARLLPVWDRMRRTRLLWALTHALLVGSLSIAVVVGAVLTLYDIRDNTGLTATFTSLPKTSSEAETLIALITMRFIPSTLALFLLSLTVGVIVVPPGALIAFPVLSRATRRLEDLATAAAALRGGDLGARSPVAGEDEVAHLQADFNAMAADLQRAQDALRAERDAVARLLDDRRELIAAVSHELRTPVATIRGYLESSLAHWQDGPPPGLRHDLDVMSGETERLRRLIDDLFTLSRAEVGQLPIAVHPTVAAPLLRRAVAAAAPSAWERGRVEVITQAADDGVTVLVDPDRLEQVVRNLVANAVRHTPPGGLVLVTSKTHGAEVVLQVRDTGEGIPAADLPRIWERFFRSTAPGAGEGEGRRDGAGLGLALVKELTEAMGGTVEVESTLGEGSCFTVRLPVARVLGKDLAPMTDGNGSRTPR